MLSSIGLGSVSALFQPITAPVGGASASSSLKKTSGGSAAGESASGSSPAPAASAGNGPGYSPAPSSKAAVAGSQGVSPVGQSATEARTAYVKRGEPESDSDRDLAAATQRRMFRAQLIDRIGQEPSAVPSAKAAGHGSSYAAVTETELDYSY